MAEEKQEVKAAEGKEAACCTKHKCKLVHKILGLKGLASIYKALGIVVILYLVYLIGTVWYLALTDDETNKLSSALLTLTLALQYSFYALLLITISRVLKTLKKIKHAVEHK